MFSYMYVQKQHKSESKEEIDNSLETTMQTYRRDTIYKKDKFLYNATKL